MKTVPVLWIYEQILIKIIGFKSSRFSIMVVRAAVDRQDLGSIPGVGTWVFLKYQE